MSNPKVKKCKLVVTVYFGEDVGTRRSERYYIQINEIDEDSKADRT